MIAKDIVCDWLREAGISFDTAVDGKFGVAGSVDWTLVAPSDFTDVIFVCGPFGNGWPVTDLMDRFRHCRFSGVNLSLLQSLSEWNPFTFLYERDHGNIAFPDITFAGIKKSVPVVGVILAHKQKEYGKKALHHVADQLIHDLTRSVEMSVIPIDTSLGNNAGGLRTPAEIESAISKMDVVLTTRLHGTVLSLKNGVPVIPVDPIAGGAKISLQVNALQWPVLFQASVPEPEKMIDAFAYCCSPAAKKEAADCAARAAHSLEGRKKQFISNLTSLRSKSA